MLCIWVLLIVSVVLVLTLQRKCWRLVWQINGLRGILQQPFLWLLLLLYLEPKSIMEGMESWRNYFRRPLAIIIGTRVLLYTDDPYTIGEILTAHECQDKTFLQEGFFARKGLLHARGQQWKIRRKQLNPAFGHKILLSFFHIFNSVGNHLQNAFSKKLHESAVSYKDVDDLLSRAVLEVSCLTLLGTQTNFTAKDVKGITSTYKSLLEISALRIIKPWLQSDRLFRWLDCGNYQAYVRCNKLVQQFVGNVVEHKHEAWLVENFPHEEGSNTVKYATSGKNRENTYKTIEKGAEKRIFIEQIFHLAQLGEMSLEDIINETHSMILVSFETVSNSLVIALLLLAMHPDCQQKLRREINATFSGEHISGKKQHSFSPGSDQNICDIEATQLQEMKYLDMIVNESLRLLTTVPINIRQVSKDFQLRLRPDCEENRKGNATKIVVVPQESIIVVDTFNMQRDCRYWGPKAKEFVPDHFGCEQPRHPYAFIPFSKGLRSCIGWRYSILLMKVFLVKLISCFEFRTQTQLTRLRFSQGISLKFQNADSITFQIRQLRETE